MKNKHQYVRFAKTVQSRPPDIQSGLDRSRLHCRFDFRQKNWGLPHLEIYLDRDRDSIFSIDSTALASTISKKFPTFPTHHWEVPTLKTCRPPDWKLAITPAVFGETKQPVVKMATGLKIQT